jgi:CDP-diacylglycerol--glycerol-3-phosphate 3-phosphatidyltransferase
MRIILTGFFVWALFYGEPNGLGALVLFSCAVVTDMLDGYYARRYNAVTKWGAFLDPVADKFLVLSAFVAFWVKGLVPLWMVVLIVIRDVVVTALRLRLVAQNVSLRTSSIAKYKTGLQFVAIYLLFVYTMVASGDKSSEWLHRVSYLVTGVLYGMLVLTYYSGIDYVYRYHQKSDYRPLTFSDMDMHQHDKK